MKNKTKLAINCFASGLSIAWLSIAVFIANDKSSTFLASLFLLINVSMAALSYKNIKE